MKRDIYGYNHSTNSMIGDRLCAKIAAILFTYLLLSRSGFCFVPWWKLETNKHFSIV